MPTVNLAAVSALGWIAAALALGAAAGAWYALRFGRWYGRQTTGDTCPVRRDLRARGRLPVEKNGFAWMKRYEERFEMSPPTPFSVWGEAHFLRSGSRERDRDVGPAERERILAFCRERLRGAAYPAARFYPDLA